ncbi:cell division protein [Salmonella enterica subsp. enterica serovar Choleraesuis]|nr:cell division protein [Salmonella enterica subsp. enterica serovar Choleraesuis]
MAVIGIQGLRGGVGTSSLAAALGWSLQQLGESVLLIDGSADNLLRLFFNIDYDKPRGWARDTLDNSDWRESAWRYTSHLDVLPFGQLSGEERRDPALLNKLIPAFSAILQEIEAANRYRWIIIDVPYGELSYSQPLLALCWRVLMVLNPDSNCHVRLHQQPIPKNHHLLVNNLNVSSQLQSDLFQLWRLSHHGLVPVVVHRDEAMAECLAAKQPLGEYQPESLSAREVLTLANWCLLRYAEVRHD